MTDALNVLQRQVKAGHLDSYIGRTYQGLRGSITVTEAGLVAAAHRQGAGHVAEYFINLRNCGWRSDSAEMTPVEKEIETRLRIF